ncbi:MAG: phytanoyl-CoA dioxygenase family protein [Chitinophagales bacterium]|nr:phytanoyl-CoA dioxygenase family protein [Chitinophagales bacterium]
MQSTAAILANEQLDKELLEQGYVVVPFLSADEVKQLVDFYYENHPKQNEGMYATAHVPDVDFRMKMNEFIKTVFARAIQQAFVNCTPLGGSFIAKGKGTNGTLHPHQDWNIVDEEKFRSFNIWVPLVDLHEDNGVIKVLPESHAWIKTYRSANISSAYESVNDVLWQKMVSLFMKKGEALIYDHRLLHASGENKTDEIRLAAVYGIIPGESTMKYYHQADENTVEVFESNPEFFLYGNIFEGPKGLKSLKKLPYNFGQFNRERMLGELVKNRVIEPMPVAPEPAKQAPSFFEKVRSLFSF